MLIHTLLVEWWNRDIPQLRPLPEGLKRKYYLSD
jgi:hypothetical protein